jgi:capsular exopolysaccharide synthesis family protein
VLLVDGDLRRPNIHNIFQVPPGPGFVSYLTGHHDWPAVVIPTAISGLDIIPCGPVPPNPAELLFSERARTLFREATEKYTMLVLDSPPILNVADSRVLSVLVDGVVIVVRGNVTPRELVRRAQAHARDAGAHVIGVVLNSIDVQRMDYYSYGYSQHDAYISEPQLEEKQG